MRAKYGDLWEDYPRDVVVVPVNIGHKANGDAVMGAGVAKVAAERFPDLPKWWGMQCQQYREDTPVMLHPGHRLILFPTKPYDGDAPWMSWKNDASLNLIWRSAAQLAAFMPGCTISIPLVGCGHGKLSPEFVLPILKTFCSHYRFQLVVTKKEQIIVDGILHENWPNWLLQGDPRPSEDGTPQGTHFLKEIG